MTYTIFMSAPIGPRDLGLLSSFVAMRQGGRAATLREGPGAFLPPSLGFGRIAGTGRLAPVDGRTRLMTDILDHTASPPPELIYRKRLSLRRDLRELWQSRELIRTL